MSKKRARSVEGEFERLKCSLIKSKRIKDEFEKPAANYPASMLGRPRQRLIDIAGHEYLFSEIIAPVVSVPEIDAFVEKKKNGKIYDPLVPILTVQQEKTYRCLQPAHIWAPELAIKCPAIVRIHVYDPRAEIARIVDEELRKVAEKSNKAAEKMSQAEPARKDDYMLCMEADKNELDLLRAIVSAIPQGVLAHDPTAAIQKFATSDLLCAHYEKYFKGQKEPRRAAAHFFVGVNAVSTETVSRVFGKKTKKKKKEQTPVQVCNESHAAEPQENENPRVADEKNLEGVSNVRFLITANDTNTKGKMLGPMGEHPASANVPVEPSGGQSTNVLNFQTQTSAVGVSASTHQPVTDQGKAATPATQPEPSHQATSETEVDYLFLKKAWDSWSKMNDRITFDDLLAAYSAHPRQEVVKRITARIKSGASYEDVYQAHIAKMTQRHSQNERK